MILDFESSDIKRLITSDSLEMKALAKNVSSQDHFFDIAVRALSLWDSMEVSRDRLYEIEGIVKKELQIFDNRMICAAIDYLGTGDADILNNFLSQQTTIQDLKDDDNIENYVEYIKTDSNIDNQEKDSLADANIFIGFFRSSPVSDVYITFARDSEEIVARDGSDLTGFFAFDAARFCVLTMIILACAVDDFSLQEARYCLGRALSSYECSIELISKDLESKNTLPTRRTDLVDIINRGIDRSGEDVSTIRASSVFSLLSRMDITFMGESVNTIESDGKLYLTYDGKRFSTGSVRKAAERILKKQKDTQGH